MKRTLVAMAAGLALSGCATKPQVSDEERHAAYDAFIACLHTNARKLDDGMSEASTVALGLRSLCAGEFAAASNAAASGLNPRATEIFHQRYDDQMFMQQATAAVLSERANRRR